MLQRALAGYGETLEPDHLGTLMVILGLGMLYQDWGKLNEAETMLKRALAGYEKVLEPTLSESSIFSPYSITAGASSTRQRRCGNGLTRAMRKL